jgi:hypothetical protein
MPTRSVDEIQKTLDDLAAVSAESLSEYQKSLLSLVLFPDTHTDTFEFGGEQYTVSPLTIKYAKKLHADLLPVMKKAEAAENSPQRINFDNDIVDALATAVLTLCDFYGAQWAQIRQAVVEEDVDLQTLQKIVVLQEGVQGTNDFLLGPLRLVIRLMQVQEILSVKMSPKNQSTCTMQPSAASGE